MSNIQLSHQAAEIYENYSRLKNRIFQVCNTLTELAEANVVFKENISVKKTKYFTPYLHKMSFSINEKEVTASFLEVNTEGNGSSWTERGDFMFPLSLLDLTERTEIKKEVMDSNQLEILELQEQISQLKTKLSIKKVELNQKKNGL